MNIEKKNIIFGNGGGFLESGFLFEFYILWCSMIYVYGGGNFSIRISI